MSNNRSGRIRSSGNSIYFIAAADRALIKIGITCELQKRFVSLQLSSPVPLVLLAAAPTAQNWVEGALHYHFREQWHHGEWFTPNAELLALIDYVKAAGVVPPVKRAPAHFRFPARSDDLRKHRSGA